MHAKFSQINQQILQTFKKGIFQFQFSYIKNLISVKSVKVPKKFLKNVIGILFNSDLTNVTTFFYIIFKNLEYTFSCTLS